MSKPQPKPAQNPDLAPHPVPTLCDTCRATGTAGASPFEDLAGLLDFTGPTKVVLLWAPFTPVPVRSHANNWTPEHQRAFVAALAITGTEREAARSIGRYAAGADRLRKLPRGKSFADACQNALDLFRERELAGLDAAMVKLDEQAREARAHRKDVFATIDYHREPDPGAPLDEEDVAETRQRIADKLERLGEKLKRRELASYLGHPDKMAAYELLYGKQDWERAAEHKESGAQRASLRESRLDTADGYDEGGTRSESSDGRKATGSGGMSGKAPTGRKAGWIANGGRPDPDGADDTACADDLAITNHPPVLSKVEGAPTIEAAQAREINGGKPMGDYRDADGAELQRRGFEVMPGKDGVRIRRL